MLAQGSDGCVSCACCSCCASSLLACWPAGFLACWLAGLLACWLAGLLASMKDEWHGMNRVVGKGLESPKYPTYVRVTFENGHPTGNATF